MVMNEREPIRTCKYCGVNSYINTERSLNRFVKNITSKYGRLNVCTICFNRRRREYGREKAWENRND